MTRTGDDTTTSKAAKCIYFVYVDEKILSGQRRATELIIDELTLRGWDCRRLPMPGFERDGFLPYTLARFACRLIAGWWRVLESFPQHPGILHINLGQSVPAMLREGMPLMLCSVVFGWKCSVISLHGSWLMKWRPDSLQARWMRKLVSQAQTVTVLGTDQKAKLMEFGIPGERIAIVDNTCAFSPLEAESVAAKHQAGRRVQVLFLSNLVDTKGYPEYLEALETYARRPENAAIDAILCGQVVAASHGTRFLVRGEARQFIEHKLQSIQATGKVRVTWIPDAEGEAKHALFLKTQIFVFPSKLEAQPLVLLEAMATGCAIITTRVGQIPRMLDAASSIQLDRAHAENLADAMAELVKDADRCRTMALAGLERFKAGFTRRHYCDRWLSILTPLAVKLSHGSAAHTFWFIFADTPGFSGQKEASRLIFENIGQDKQRIRLVRMPALDRSGYLIAGFGRYLRQFIQASWSTLVAAFRPDSVVHLALGQTRLSLLRDGLPLFLVMAWRSRKSAVVSLNGSNFMHWRPDCFEARLFRIIMYQANYLTVLGESQRAQAISLGITPEKLLIVPNACDAPGMGRAEVTAKQRQPGPLRLLHLSSLIDTKGYPAFLEALLLLGTRTGRQIEAVLCGNITISQFGSRFSSTHTARDWINDMLLQINRSERVKVRWIPGARGEEKWGLYQEAQVFVFPSSYLVEAQPLVLLEAMAFGCAVVTTGVGEVRSVVDESMAMFLEKPESWCIAEAIAALENDQEQRSALALAAWQRYQTSFTREIYLERWEEIFSSLSERRAP